MNKHVRSALILFGIWTSVGLVFSGVSYLAVVAEDRPETAWTVLSNSLARSYLWGLFSPLLYVFAKRFPVHLRSIRWHYLAANLAFGTLISLAYSLIFVAFVRLINPDLGAGMTTSAVVVQRLLIPTLYTFFSLYSPTFFMIQALIAFRRYRDERERNAALEAEVTKAQLSALKMQLHPHFLFNSLHAISSLIVVDPDRANKMVALLGDFLRRTLEHSEEQTVTLDEELGFLRCYLEIEETRFADRLSVSYEVEDETLTALVPHLILQPIVENAVKHGIAPYEFAGRIDIRAERIDSDILLSVSDSGNGGQNEPPGQVVSTNGLGITNVRARLARIYGDRASLSITPIGSGGCCVRIRVPFHTASHARVDGSEPIWSDL